MNFEPTEQEKRFFAGLDPKEAIVPRVHFRHRHLKQTSSLSGRDARGTDISAARRKRLDDSDFALPGRRYPIDTLARARNALARIAQYGTALEIRAVRKAVHKRWPEIDMPEFREDEVPVEA